MAPSVPLLLLAGQALALASLAFAFTTSPPPPHPPPMRHHHRPRQTMSTIRTTYGRTSSSAPISHSIAMSARHFQPPSAVGGGLSAVASPHEQSSAVRRPSVRSATTSSGARAPHPPHDVLSDVCRLLGAAPSDLLRLDCGNEEEGGERGVFLNRPVKKNDILLSIPLSSCLRDDEPPIWFRTDDDDDDEWSAADSSDNHASSSSSSSSSAYHDPSAWSTRLASCLLDLQLRKEERGVNLEDGPLGEGRQTWLALLPDKSLLRASLPVHWPEEVLANAKCTALELAVDSSYFARAAAVDELVEALMERRRRSGEERLFLGDHLSGEDVRRMCHDALDLVQTRSCRVERTCHEDGVQWGPPIRILAPVFDCINHGSSRYTGDGSANASFRLEGCKVFSDLTDAFLVVRSMIDMNIHDEVLIDYGDSARPAWKCLASYGFVPEYRILSPEEEEATEDDDEGGGGEEAPEHVAEVFKDGIRYEVGPYTVPYELAEDVSASLSWADAVGEELSPMGGGDSDNQPVHKNVFTPPVALHIAKRVSDVAFQLLLEPELIGSTVGGSDSDDGDEDEDNEGSFSPEEICAARSAASLRWSQHQVLLACAINLRDFAAQQSNIV